MKRRHAPFIVFIAFYFGLSKVLRDTASEKATASFVCV